VDLRAGRPGGPRSNNPDSVRRGDSRIALAGRLTRRYHLLLDRDTKCPAALGVGAADVPWHGYAVLDRKNRAGIGAFSQTDDIACRFPACGHDLLGSMEDKNVRFGHCVRQAARCVPGGSSPPGRSSESASSSNKIRNSQCKSLALTCLVEDDGARGDRRPKARSFPSILAQALRLLLFHLDPTPSCSIRRESGGLHEHGDEFAAVEGKQKIHRASP
jgi:hypothetical protein